MKKDEWTLGDFKPHVKFFKQYKNCDNKTFLSEERCRYLYKITCIANGKSYIGRSTQPQIRIQNHYVSLSNGKHKVELFQKDFDLYGGKNFTVEIIGEDNFENHSERKMQELFKTYDPQYGYNYKDRYWVMLREVSNDRSTDY